MSMQEVQEVQEVQKGRGPLRRTSGSTIPTPTAHWPI